MQLLAFMLAFLLNKLGDFLEASERCREDYLAQSSDPVNLERRQRWLERNGYLK